MQPMLRSRSQAVKIPLGLDQIHIRKGVLTPMSSGSHKKSSATPKTPSGGRKKKAAPEWADGLKQIYDSVLDEPLPDSFNELLAKLDDPS